jgi:uncharacterized membrane protein
MHDMRTALSTFIVILASACQPAGEPAPVADAPVSKRPGAQAQTAPAPVVLAGVDLSQPVRAIGTEPFWSVEIRQDQLVYSGVDRPETKMTNPGAEVHGDAAIIAAKDAAGADFAVALRAAQCSDGMSDRVYPLAAEITYKGETLKGCANSQAALDTGPRP